jgi:hypothetical protein
VFFDSPLKGGGRQHAVLLYSDAGLRLSLLKEGQIVELDLGDIGSRGLATVVKIRPSTQTAKVEATVLRIVEFLHADDLGRILYGEWDPPKEFIDNWRSRRQEIHLRLDYPDGRWCDAWLLRTVKWIEEMGAAVGATIFLDLAEVGTRGWARVLEIAPCGPVEIGRAGFDMVTGKFCHSEGRIGELILESESEPIGVTPGHLFWSEDRKAWVPVHCLRRGERLHTLKGTTRVISYTMTDRVEPVYNLEVENSHCFRVGESGVLVHNMSGPPPSCVPGCVYDDGPGTPGPYKDLALGDTTTKITYGPAAVFKNNPQIVRILQANRDRPENDGLVYSDDPIEGRIRLYVGIEEFYKEDYDAGRLFKKAGAWWKRLDDGRAMRIYIKDSPLFPLQATVDHIKAKDNGGSNSYCNARVHSRRRGSQKGTSDEF